MQEVDLRPKYQVALSDLQGWHRIALGCFQCQHTATLYPGTLRRRFYPRTRIIDIERRFKCTRCGARGKADWSIVRLPR